ncbi:MAG TPA: hypothetical protein VGK73_11270 [Polyangiaceae bacterium]
MSLYYQNEEGVAAQNYDGTISQSTEPKPPRFAPGVDAFMMFTVIDRLRAADKHMPCLKRRVAMVDGKVARDGTGGVCSGSLPATQSVTGEARPSASMVLRARYGVLSCKYDDSAPNGDEFLRLAQEAYVKAAQEVSRRAPRVTAADKLNARFDRAFGEED